MKLGSIISDCEYLPLGYDGVSCEKDYFSDSHDFKACVIFFVFPARVGEADAWHHRVLLQTAGGGRSSSAADCSLHRRNVCEGADGGGETVSETDGCFGAKNLDSIQTFVWSECWAKTASFSFVILGGTNQTKMKSPRHDALQIGFVAEMHYSFAT